MRRWTDFPRDNSDRSVRIWLTEVLLGSGLVGLADERECRGVADRLVAGVDDRSRTVLELMGRRYDEAELNNIGKGLDQVLDGAPVQHAVGWTEFRGLRIACGPEALIPRPETEEVAEWFLQGMESGKERRPKGEPVRVVDWGTGTGCVALALKALRPDWEVWGADVSDRALDLARENGRRLGLDVHWLEASMLDSAREPGWPPWSGIVSNPPYIPASEADGMESHVRDREPHLALFVPDADPLRFHRALRERAEEALAVGGCMVAECHPKFTRSVADCWQLEGAETEVLIDLQGAERAVRLIRH